MNVAKRGKSAEKWPFWAAFCATNDAIPQQLLRSWRYNLLSGRNQSCAMSSSTVSKSDVAGGLRKSIFEQKTTRYVRANNFVCRVDTAILTPGMSSAGDLPSGMTHLLW